MKLDNNTDIQISDFTDAVTEAYLNLLLEDEDVEGHSLLKDVALEFNITPLKVRKDINHFWSISYRNK